eukprot:8279331-Pyramimonas_sp.AAC.1
MRRGDVVLPDCAEPARAPPKPRAIGRSCPGPLPRAVEGPDGGASQHATNWQTNEEDRTCRVR